MFALTTAAAPDRPNHDVVLAGAEVAVIVDGAGGESGACRHDVPWYARQLAAQTMVALVDEPDVTLVEGLARGLHAVSRLHVYTCDLRSSGTPYAAIGIVRIGPETVDTLALGDCAVLIDTDGGLAALRDMRIDQACGAEEAVLAGLRIGTAEHHAALERLQATRTATRNTADGWWAAANDPEAARQARTASHPRAAVRGVVAMTDGATRPVDRMKAYAWPDYLDLLARFGPEGLIAHVRSIEASDPDGAGYPRASCHDAASVILITL